MFIFMFMFMHVVDSSYVFTSLKKSFPSFVCHENVIDDGGDDDYVQVRVANNFFVFFFLLIFHSKGLFSFDYFFFF